jgi:hypothetical protein
VLRDEPLPATAPEVPWRLAAPDDAPEIEALVNGSLQASKNSMICKTWILEDLFLPGRFNAIVSVQGHPAGFGALAHGKGQAELSHACLLPPYHESHSRAILALLLHEFGKRRQDRLLYQVETRDARRISLCREFGFRPDPDLYVNVYDA